MELRFNHLESLHWLWLVMALAALLVVGLTTQRRRLRRFAEDVVLARLIPTASAGRRTTRAGLLLGAMLLLVVSLLDPRWGVTYEEVQQQGIDVFVVLDVSRSMLAEDVRPNRLERARQYVRDMLDRLAGDRVGLVTFAGVPSLSCPLTVDYGAVRLSLDEASPELVARGGSSLGDALRLAVGSFTDDVKDFKAIVLLTDGEDHGSFPVEAAAQAFEERGVRIFAVGIGDTEEGARIPVQERGQTVYLTHEGQQVWSRMDAALLREVALASEGAFVPAGTRDVNLGRIYDERIAATTKRDFGTARIRQYHVQFQWFAAIALGLLLAESVIADRRPRARAAPVIPAREAA
ncbi:MAG: VWA domain-containing protein [Planctomycetota bacterium]|jgi:Ca-activated chloride channel family protein